MYVLELEKIVIDYIIEHTPRYADKLARQYASARVTGREFTNFEVADKASSLGNGIRLALGDVVAEVEGVEHGVGLVLFIEDGLMTCLEGYVFGDEAFPDNIGRFRISETRVAFHAQTDEKEV